MDALDRFNCWKLASWAALRVLPLFAAARPADERPAAAVAAAEEYARNGTWDDAHRAASAAVAARHDVWWAQTAVDLAATAAIKAAWLDPAGAITAATAAAGERAAAATAWPPGDGPSAVVAAVIARERAAEAAEAAVAACIAAILDGSLDTGLPVSEWPSFGWPS